MITSALHERQSLESETDLAAGETAPVDRRQVERRGPMRPERLVSPRRRLRGFAISYAFRALDALALAILAAVSVALSAAGNPRTITIGAAATSIAFALMAATLLKATGSYEFRRRERHREHFIRAATGIAVTAAVTSACLAVTRAPANIGEAVLLQAGLTLSALPAIHAGWMALVRRWRRLGLLTQNVIVVRSEEHTSELQSP